MTVALAVIEEIKVGDNHRDGEGDRKHPGDSTERSDQLAPRPDRPHVAIPHGGHGHHRPPERVRDTGEVGQPLGLEVGLGEVDGAGEQNDADDEEENEQAELAQASANRQSEDLQTLGVPGQLEDTEDPNQADHPEDGERARLRAELPGITNGVRHERDEVRHYR